MLKNILIDQQIKKITFTPYAWAKINCYINIIGDLEITGFGKVEDGMVTDIAILKQEVQSAEADTPSTAISDFLASLPEDEIRAGVWSLDWHSHVNMATSPSVTDERNYDQMLKIRMYKPFPLIIINKQQNIYSAVYIGNKIYRDLDVFYQSEISEDELNKIYAECKKDISEKCVEKIYHYETLNNYGGYYKNGVYYSGKSSSINNSNNVLTNKNVYDNIEEEEIEDFMRCKFCGDELYYQEEIQSGYCSQCLEDMREQNALS